MHKNGRVRDKQREVLAALDAQARQSNEIYCLFFSDVDLDPDPWIRTWIPEYKIKGKAEFNQQIFWGFCGKYTFKSETKKVASSKVKVHI